MPIVTVWHNVARDGLDRPLGMLDGFKPEHPLTPVSRYTVDAVNGGREARMFAEEAFTTFNVGEDPDFNGALETYRVDLAVEYRKRENRSLSVGDVVQVDSRWYACGRVGWERIESPALLVWTDVYGSHALSPHGDSAPAVMAPTDRTLSAPTMSLLGQIIRAANRFERVGRVIEGTVYRGQARSICQKMGDYLTTEADVRDGYLRVTLDGGAGVDTYWPVMDLVRDLADGQFFTNIADTH